MIYLLLYLAAGAITMVVPLCFQKLEAKTDRFAAAIPLTDWSEAKKMRETVIGEFVVPFLGNLFVLFAWPVILHMKLSDMWQSGKRRSVDVPTVAVTGAASGQQIAPPQHVASQCNIHASRTRKIRRSVQSGHRRGGTNAKG
jgi:hypothetical protein